ncbi:MAG: hypothetical protein ACRD59_09230 [Candidatus Acidiferrales bacterium]
MRDRDYILSGRQCDGAGLSALRFYERYGFQVTGRPFATTPRLKRMRWILLRFFDSAARSWDTAESTQRFGMRPDSPTGCPVRTEVYGR